jgi:hypothetical protein
VSGRDDEEDAMGADDILNEAKGMLSGHEEQVDQVIDKAAEAIEGKTPDNVDGMVQGAADKAKDLL